MKLHIATYILRMDLRISVAHRVHDLLTDILSMKNATFITIIQYLIFLWTCTNWLRVLSLQIILE